MYTIKCIDILVYLQISPIYNKQIGKSLQKVFKNENKEALFTSVSNVDTISLRLSSYWKGYIGTLV